MNKAIGIIPARGGSKGVPRKNIRLVAGRPLIAYSIEAAHHSSLTAFFVSTDDFEIAEVARTLGAEVILRPPELATDNTPMPPVLVHVLETLSATGEDFEVMVLLQPTAPLRTAQDIDASLSIMFEANVDSVVSVAPVPRHYHPDWQFVVAEGTLRLYNGDPFDQIVTRRQLLSDTYTRNGAIYAVRTGIFLERQSLYTANTRAYIMPDERSVNIDSEQDLQLAELLLSHS